MLTTAPAAEAAWCGDGPVAADRQPDAARGYQWHVVYAYPSDGEDRFATWAPRIADDLAAIDAWLAREDSTRRLRLDTHSFSGCLGLDLSSVRLPLPMGWYAEEATSLERIAESLAGAPTHFSAEHKKYLVYYDGIGYFGPDQCGEGYTGHDGGGAWAYVTVRIRNCGQESADALRRVTTAHEMLHGLNALPSPFPDPGPPNVCPDDDGHPCDSEDDIITPYVDDDDSLDTRRLDVGRDDYYDHPGPWTDVRDSNFLVRLDGPNLEPPGAAAGLTATDNRRAIIVSWSPPANAVGAATYSVFLDGELLTQTQATTVRVPYRPQSTWDVVVVDETGLPSDPARVIYHGGLGLVDHEGRLVRDTVAPYLPSPLRVSVRGGRVAATWRAAVDGGGVRGYEIRVGGKRVRFVTKPQVTLPLAAAAGRILAVVPVDRAGNAGEPRSIRVPRR
jgi:hypothetical protein